MRTTINIDDELFARAAKLVGTLDRSAIVREGLKALFKRESARRLARLGGTQLALKVAPTMRGGSYARIQCSRHTDNFSPLRAGDNR
jgi:Arc/MetJ family transcription regulator